MGMFQPQNYGSDFVGSMAATAGMFNDKRRLDMEEKKQAQDQQRYADDRETRGIQNEGLRLDNQKKTADVEREKRLASFMDLSGRLQTGHLKQEDYGQLAGVTADLMENTPYLPNDPAEIPKYKQSISTLIKGVEGLRSLPPSNYQYSRDDNVPEVNAVLDSFQTLLSKDRIGKTFTDIDGSVTGKPGAVYKTSGVGGFAMASGEGNKAAFVPMFSIADAQGNPIVRQDGKQVLVPSTEDTSNGPDAKVRMVTPEEMLTKAGYAYKVLDVADKMGLADPDRRKQYVTATMPAYMGENGAAQVLKNNQKDNSLHAYATDQDIYDGSGKLIRAATPKDKYMAVPEGGSVVETGSGRVVAEGKPKDKSVTDTYEDNGYKIHREKINGEWVVVGRNKIKEPADPAAAEGKRAQAESKAAIDKSLSEYNAAKKRVDAAKKNAAMGDSSDLESAQQELDDAKAAYTNRTSEHKAIYGREYNPIKEVVERKQGRDITPLKDGFAAKGGVFSRRDYPAFIKQAETKGWTKQEITKAAQGTDAAQVVEAYYSTPAPQQTAQQPAPKGMSAPAKAAPKQKAAPITATNKATGQRIVSNDGGKSWQPL